MRSLKTGQAWSPLVKYLPRFPDSFCILRREVHDLKIHVSAGLGVAVGRAYGEPSIPSRATKKPTGSSDSGGFSLCPAGWRRSRADSYNLPVQPEPRPCLMEPTELNNCDYRLSGALLLMYHSILKNNGGTGRNSGVIL